jgi:hyaluronan synthase/N-acetylglucosaminyltransferase
MVDTGVVWLFALLTFYGLLALTHLFIQINLSHRDYLNSIHHHRRFQSKEIKNLRTADYFKFSVAIIIPCYNEGVEDLENCVRSALDQDYPFPYQVILVDDGSKEKAAVQNVREKFASYDRLVIHEFSYNKGKRHAQKFGFDVVGDSVDIVITIDSDTILARDSVRYIVQPFDDPKVGAATGNVRAITKNLLSRLIDARYWTAFNQERSAQSLFGTVLCCSGPLAAYRNSLIQQVKEAYITERFFGTICTYGDDRHLTNLILEQGYTVKFERKAKAETQVPQRLKPWLRQQTRWNRSFYRELFWTIKRIILKRRNTQVYMLYDLCMQTILPILLIPSLIFVSYRSIVESPVYLFGYLMILVGIAILRGAYAFLRTRDRVFFLFPLYAFCHIFLLIPVRVYALCTIRTTKWGTR